uniref:Ubiquitin-like domain-containing protein n=1 Tax=Sinocyclocheilus rhinocerous TaxID=307959 RepID=A0A673MNQ0_9TELE
SRMAFQVRVRINRNEIRVLSVAYSTFTFHEFEIEKVHFIELICICLGLIFLSDPKRLRVIFGQNELQDDQTFKSCDIEHLSLLMIVLQVPGGGEGMTL